MQTAVQRRRARTRFAVKSKANGKFRLSVFRSGRHIYAQLIDDAKGVTLAAASTLQKELKAANANIAAAQKVGEAIAKKAAEKKVKEVVFDRGSYIYHGKVKALADAARKAGLKF